MNMKGTAIITVAFPDGTVRKAYVVEYPGHFTILCKIRLRLDHGSVPDKPDIDVEIIKPAPKHERQPGQRAKYNIIGHGIQYMEQIHSILVEYHRIKNKLVHVC